MGFQKRLNEFSKFIKFAQVIPKHILEILKKPGRKIFIWLGILEQKAKTIKNYTRNVIQK